jgi:hypothetical protein
VGVYGFIFFRDTQWVVVIVDEFVHPSFFLAVDADMSR